MSLAFHFFKKDVRRASWLYAIWLLLFGVEGSLALSTSPDSNANFAANLALSLLFPALHILVLAVLVPQLVQEDPPVRSTAFWLTRPVRRSTLLLAKVAGLGLVVLIPVFVIVAVLVAFGLSPDELGAAVTEILMNQLRLVVPIAVLAALTPNFSRFAAVTVAVLAGMGLLLAITAPAVGAGTAAGPFAVIALAKTRTIVEAVLLIAGGGLILAHQYLTRRNGRSVALAACLAGAYILVAGFWPWSFERDEALRSSPAVFDPAKVRLQFEAGSLNNAPYNVLSGTVRKNIDGSCHLRGLPLELSLQVRSANPRLIAPEGTAVKTIGAIPTLSSSFSDAPATSAIAAALGRIPVYSYFPDSRWTTTTFATLDEVTFLRYKDSPVRLVDDLDLVVSRYELVAELPLVSGSRYDSGSVHASIYGLVPRVDGVTVVVVESSANLLLSHRIPLAGQPTDPRLRGDPIYVLVNRIRKEAVLINPMINRSSATESRLGGLIVQQSVELPFGGENNKRHPAIDSQWLAGATLVRLERVPVAEFRKTAGVDLPKLGQPWLSDKAQNREVTPKTVEPSDKDQSDAGIVIGVSKADVVTVDGKTVTDEQLEALLVRMHKADANATVLIVANGVTQPEKLGAVMAACRTAGFDKFSLRCNAQ